MSVILEAEIGTELQLEIEGTEGRVKTTLVGVISSQLLIVHINETIAEAVLQSDSLPVVTLRGISRGQAFGFKSQTLKCLTEPQPILLVSYPKSIAKQDVRKNRRVKCLLPAKFAQDTTGIGGVIADLSNSGCHFQTSTDLNEHQAAIVQLENSVLISFQLPGKETPKTVEGAVRNTYVDGSTVHIGFEFTDVDSATLKAMDEFIALSFEIQPF